MYQEVLPALDTFCRTEAGLTTFMELFPRCNVFYYTILYWYCTVLASPS